MKLTKAFFAVLIIVVGVYLWGCCGGSKETVVVPQPQGQSSSTPTLGKQLEDLNEAYKKGAITKDEYEAAKKKLLEQK